MTTIEPATDVAPAPQPLAAETAGNGDTTLVLIHGFPLTSSMWRHQVDALASSSLRVVAPDLPGFGRTPGVMSSVDVAADDIANYLNGIGARRIVLAGFSMGGYVAFAFVRRHAAMLAGLILVDTKAEPDTAEGKEGRYALAERAMDDGKEVVIDSMLPRLLSESTMSGRPEIVEQVRDVAEQATLEGIAAALRAIAERPSSVADLPRIAVPTLIIVGKEDAITPPKDAESMAAAIRGAKLVVIPDSGHTTPLEQPEAVTKAMRDWLAANISP